MNTQVRGVVFRVHSYLFATHSTQWAEKLAATDRKKDPVIRQDISPEDMSAFLSMLYPS